MELKRSRGRRCGPTLRPFIVFNFSPMGSLAPTFPSMRSLAQLAGCCTPGGSEEAPPPPACAPEVRKHAHIPRPHAPTQAYEAAIEAKQVAQQEAERAKFVVDKALQEKQVSVHARECSSAASWQHRPPFTLIRTLSMERHSSMGLRSVSVHATGVCACNWGA